MLMTFLSVHASIDNLEKFLILGKMLENVLWGFNSSCLRGCDGNMFRSTNHYETLKRGK